MTSTFEKERELQNFLQLYDTAIERQENLLVKFAKGKFKTTQVSDQVLGGLIRGDLNLLRKQRDKIATDLREATNTNGFSQITTNGYTNKSDDEISSLTQDDGDQ